MKKNDAIAEIESLDTSVNARLGEIENEIESIDVNTLEWMNVHDLLENYD